MSRKKAFIIGANKKGLQFAESDAEKMRDAFEEADFDTFYSVEDANTMTSSECPNHIRTFFSDLKKGDTALFYFAGHSFTVGRNKTLYLALQHSDITDARNSCLCILDVETVIRECEATNKIIILDSCNSGASFKDVKEDLYRTNYMILCAAEAAQDVHEIDQPEVNFKGGLLTHLICEGLSGEAMDKNGQITTSSLISWIQGEEKNYKTILKLEADIVCKNFGRGSILVDFESGVNFLFETENLEDTQEIPSECWEQLELVKKLDHVFPLNDIGNRDNLWVPLLDLAKNERVPIRSKRLVIEIISVFNNLQYPKKKSLIIFFRKHAEVELLYEIYNSLKTNFKHNLPKNKPFLSDLSKVDEFDYSQSFLNFNNSRWIKLETKHNEKQQNLYNILLRIIHADSIGKKSKSLLRNLSNHIHDLIDKIEEQKSLINQNQDLQYLLKIDPCQQQIGQFLNLFEELSNIVSDKYRDYQNQFKTDIKGIQDAVPNPITIKQKVTIRNL